MNWKVYVACNFNGHVKSEERIMVTGRYVHYNSGLSGYLTKMQGIDIVTTDH